MKPTGTVAVDWDGTLVDAKTQAWLEGGHMAMMQFCAEWRVVIVHSCRANWPEGVDQITKRLGDLPAAVRDQIRIEPKPVANLYVGDNYVRFGGSWPSTMLAIRQDRQRARAGRRGAPA